MNRRNHSQWNRQFLAGIFTLCLLLSGVAAPFLTVFAAPPANSSPADSSKKKGPIEIVADTIEYDSTKGVIVAEGSVVITRNQGVMTGAKVEYYEKTKDAYMTGGVKAVDGDATLTSEALRSYNDNHLVATGDVVLTKGTSKVTGPKVEYFSDRQYAVVPADGRVETEDGFMTADFIEAFLDKDSAAGTGHVHVVSPPRQLDATANEGVYYGSPKGQSKAILTGNARAVQEGNVLTGDVLVIKLDEKGMDSHGGRSRLVVTPK